jgi:hypothetical protein
MASASSIVHQIDKPDNEVSTPKMTMIKKDAIDCCAKQ